MSEEYIGCGNHACRLEKPKGQGLNGGCMCLHALPTADRLRVEKALWRRDREIERLQEKLEGLESKELVMVRRDALRAYVVRNTEPISYHEDMVNNFIDILNTKPPEGV